MELLKELCEAHGVSGREEEVMDLIVSHIKDHVDEYEFDAMGNLMAKRLVDPSKKWLVIACHADEIGFYVRHIDKKGFLRVQPMGGFDTRNLFARRVIVKTKEEKLVGILNPAVPPVHVATPEQRKKVPTTKEFYVDLGLPVEEVKKKVRLGDPITLEQTFTQVGDNVSCKAMDNRSACWVGINLLKELQNPVYNIAVMFTVQEEVGVRGATAGTYTLNPDISIAVDVTLACDTPGVDEEDYISRLGKGTCIKISDGGMIANHQLVEQMTQLAENNKIPYQMEMLPAGGTDGRALQQIRGGSQAIALSIPTRYIHTIVETINFKDLQATLDLLKTFCTTSTENS